MTATALTFADVWIGMWVAHQVGDRVLQTDDQAVRKGKPGGWVFCARHVASYTAATSVLTAVLWFVLGLSISPVGFIAGQLVSAATHFWADLRTTLHRLVVRVTPWNRNYYENVPGGAEHIDQTWHYFWLFIAALLTAVIR